MIQIGFNFINEFKYCALLTLLTPSLSSVGAYRMIYHEEGDLNTILIQKKRLGSMISLSFNVIILLTFLHYLLHFGQ